MNETETHRWMAVWATVLVGFCLACGGGATFGENSPGNAEYGGGTYLDDAWVPPDAPEGTIANGSIAVDPDTEYVYTMQVGSTAGDQEKRLVVIPPGEDARVLMDLTGYTDIRILFPPESVLVMAEPDSFHESVGTAGCRRPTDANKPVTNLISDCADNLFWFDKSARTRLRHVETNARYHGTRLSAKRNYLAVADNFQDGENMHLLDTETGETNIVPNSMGWFEAMWLHEEDVLISAGFERDVETEDGSQRVRHLRIREWSPRAGQEQADLSNSTCFVDDTARGNPEGCDVMVPGIQAMFTTGFSWIGVSPDDRWVAVPAQREDGRAVVVLVDRTNQEVHLLENTHGPVGFTPDSGTLIGFGFERPYFYDNLLDELGGDPGDDPFLAVVDLETMEVEHQPTPGDDSPTFFVSHDSSDVVVANLGTGEGMMIVDLAGGDTAQMAGPAVAQRGRLVDLNRDPTATEYELDTRRLSASNLIAERSIAKWFEACDERVCRGDEEVRIGLGEFVSRRGHQELWLLEHPLGTSGELVRIDLEGGYSEVIPLDRPAARINIQPDRDRLVLDTPGEMAIRFYDPERRRVDSEAAISLGWHQPSIEAVA